MFLHSLLGFPTYEKRVEGSSSSIIINKTRTFVWFLSFPGKDLSICKNTNGKSCGDSSSVEFKQHWLCSWFCNGADLTRHNLTIHPICFSAFIVSENP
ncbi:hypothetical protein L1887_32519 [Cichorium endivia]|nr:hypothetical protein L1887_32519 [Cichorium endivia]